MNKDNTSKYQSLIITVIVGVLCLLLLLLNLTIKQSNENKPLMIEVAMLQESNFGNTDLGKGEEEPAPSFGENTPKESVPEKSITEIDKKRVAQPKAKPIKTKAQKTEKKIPIVSEKPTAKSKAKVNTNENATSKSKKSNASSGNPEANAALKNILSGKGKAKSNGQGDSNSFGNTGDPKGNSDLGKGIGENWKTRVPKNQSHNCSASGVVIVDIVVNANGSIKRATPRVTNSQCLANRAKELVLKYVTAFPGADGRRGSYKVVLK